MNDRVPFRKDDQDAVLSHVGDVLPVVFREAVDDGFYRHALSRQRDPEGYVEYGKCCRANMLYDRIVASARYLCDGAREVMPALRYDVTDNQRSTEFMSGPFLVFRLKRIKRNRKNLTTSVKTGRQGIIRSPYCQSVGQQSLPFPDDVDYLPRENRVWLTIGYDLDELEEAVSRVVLGVETRKRWMWLRPLSAGEPEVLASLPAPVADRIQEARRRRA